MTLPRSSVRRPTRSLFRTLARRAAPLALLAAVVALPAAFARADSISYSSTGTGKGLEVEAQLQRVENGQLVYVSVKSGRRDLKPFDQIIQIKSTAEPALSAAEAAFAADK